MSNLPPLPDEVTNSIDWYDTMSSSSAIEMAWPLLYAAALRDAADHFEGTTDAVIAAYRKSPGTDSKNSRDRRLVRGHGSAAVKSVVAQMRHMADRVLMTSPVSDRRLRPHAVWGDDPSGYCGCADCTADDMESPVSDPAAGEA